MIISRLKNICNLIRKKAKKMLLVSNLLVV